MTSKASRNVFISRLIMLKIFTRSLIDERGDNHRRSVGALSFAKAFFLPNFKRNGVCKSSRTFFQTQIQARSAPSKAEDRRERTNERHSSGEASFSRRSRSLPYALFLCVLFRIDRSRCSQETDAHCPR